MSEIDRSAPDVARCFNELGIAEFLRWLHDGAAGPVPAALLNDTEFSTPLEKSPLSEVPHFQDRYEFGVFLVDLLKPYDPHQISYNPGLWSWLAALFFEQLAPVDADGKRALRRPDVYVLRRESTLLSPSCERALELVCTHGPEARYLLSPIRVDDPAPLSRQSYLLDQLAARQFVISSRRLLQPRGAYSPILERAAKDGEPARRAKAPPGASR